MERDDSLDRDSKDFSKQSSEKSSSKAKRKHKVWDLLEHIPVSAVLILVMLETFPLNVFLALTGVKVRYSH